MILGSWLHSDTCSFGKSHLFVSRCALWISMCLPGGTRSCLEVRNCYSGCTTCSHPGMGVLPSKMGCMFSRCALQWLRPPPLFCAFISTACHPSSCGRIWEAELLVLAASAAAHPTGPKMVGRDPSPGKYGVVRIRGRGGRNQTSEGSSAALYLPDSSIPVALPLSP